MAPYQKFLMFKVILCINLYSYTLGTRKSQLQFCFMVSLNKFLCYSLKLTVYNIIKAFYKLLKQIWRIEVVKIAQIYIIFSKISLM